MRIARLILTTAAALLLSGCMASSSRFPAPVLVRTIALPGVNGARPGVGVPGRLDHLAHDPTTDRLFIAALENDSLEVVDRAAGQRIRSFPGLGHPQGAAVLPAAGRVVVACSAGRVYIYDTRALELIHTVDLGRGADNVRCDAARNRVFVTYGDTDGGAIAELDPHTWEKHCEIRFPHRPESFQLDPNSPRIFANVPGGVRATTDGCVMIANRTTDEIQATIPLPGQWRNFPMAYDAAHDRLFIVCRKPARLIVLDPTRGVQLDARPCAEDSDDVCWDERAQRVIVIGGGFRPDLEEPDHPAPPEARDETGRLDVFAVSPAGQLSYLAATPTAPHARTGLFVPQHRRLYVAAPPHGDRDAVLLEYRVAD